MAGKYRALKSIYDNISTVLFVIVIGCLLLQVFARYVLQLAVPWTEELGRFMLVISVFFGSVIAFRKGGHLGAFFLRDRVTGRLRGFLHAFNNLVILCVLVLLFLGSLTMRAKTENLDASTMHWFMHHWLYDAALVGYGLMFCYGVRDLYLSILALLGKKEIAVTGLSCPEPEED